MYEHQNTAAQIYSKKTLQEVTRLASQQHSQLSLSRRYESLGHFAHANFKKTKLGDELRLKSV